MRRVCAIGAFAACAGRTEGGRVFFPLPRKRGQASPLRRGRIPVQGQSTLVAPHGAGERQQSIGRISFPRQIALRLRSEHGRLISLLHSLRSSPDWLTSFTFFLSLGTIYVFTGGPAHDIIEVLDFFYIKS